MKLSAFHTVALSKKNLPYSIAVVVIVLLLCFILLLTLARIKKPEAPERQTGIILQQSYDGALPVKPIDQRYFQKIIQKSWDEALVKGATNIVAFPKDPQLVAFTYKPPGSTTARSLVLYRNKPITIKTKKVIELPGGVSSRVTLSSQGYALVVLFEYTPAVAELNIEQTLAVAFQQAIAGKAISN